jgi:hypothetical protein
VPDESDLQAWKVYRAEKIAEGVHPKRLRRSDFLAGAKTTRKLLDIERKKDETLQHAEWVIGIHSDLQQHALRLQEQNIALTAQLNSAMMDMQRLFTLTDDPES